MKIHIRDVQIGDARGVAKVGILSWQSAYRGIIDASILDALDIEKAETRWENNIEGNDFNIRTIVAVHNDEIIAFASYGEERDMEGSEHGELWAIYVHPDFTGMKIGHQIWDTFKPERTQYSNGSVVWVLKENIKAMQFYSNLGFNPDGAQKYYKTGGQSYPEIRMFLLES